MFTSARPATAGNWRAFATLLVLAMLLPAAVLAQTTFSGYVYDAANGEALTGATVAAPALRVGTTTNSYGFFSLTLPAPASDATTEVPELVVSFVGYTPLRQQVSKGGQLSFRLKALDNELEEVTVTAPTEDADAAAAVRAPAVSRVQLTAAQLRTLPALAGERDILKAIQLLPGIKRGGEGQTGMQVRGGGPDQNLILLDEAVVYNVSHLFGFLSVFNDDALKDVTVYTGGFPAQYGGRISSVLDVRTREGDARNYHVTGGVGLLSSRLTVDGPIVKDKASFLISGRRSYIDQAMKVARRDIPYYFYDFNAKLNWRLSPTDRLYYNSYYGNDILKEPSGMSGGEDAFNFKFSLGNLTHSLRWNHLYSDKLFANYSLIYTRFRYEVTSGLENNSLYMSSRVGDYTLKLDHDLFLSPRAQVKFGATTTLHRFRPNVVAIQAENLGLVNDKHAGPLMTPTEVAVYGAVEQEVAPRLRLNYGLRVSGLRAPGARTYLNPEPRFGAAWSLNENSSLKLGVARMAQYVHLVSSSSLALPTDLWYPVTRRVKPLLSDQLTVAYHRTVPQLGATFSAEGYYKTMNRLIEYREGAVLALNDAYEDELVTGKGKAYGVELLARRTKGRLTGWVGYTLSWATRTFPDLNGGKTFFAKYDRRHDLSVVAAYEVSKKLSVSSVWTYATGQRLTAALGYFPMPQPTYTGVDALPIYSGRNALKFSASHRLDLSVTWRPHPENDRKWHGEWQVGAYNVYNRTQPYKVEVVPTNGGFKYQQVGLFGCLPFVSYNFSF